MVSDRDGTELRSKDRLKAVHQLCVPRVPALKRPSFKARRLLQGVRDLLNDPNRTRMKPCIRGLIITLAETVLGLVGFCLVLRSPEGSTPTLLGA